MKDVLGRALREHFFDGQEYKLWVHDHIGPKVEMLVPVYFRDFDSMPDLEQTALDLCYGKVLDIGAGAGSHALALKDMGRDVTALDISEGAVAVMEARGVEQVLQADIFELNGQQYDTLLLLMNGIGLVGSLGGLERFLLHAGQLLREGGQLLFDSSDVAYLYEDGAPMPKDRYYGEIDCCYEYRRVKSEWFTWLYIDRDTLSKIAEPLGWRVELIDEDETGQYLVRLSR
ncbi:MAG: class I SAM-dependent methyltransferase [Chitinophagaceae bacterium]